MRALNKIAREISSSWKNVSPYAKPYLDAMYNLHSVSDKLVCDDGRDIVLRFLTNAGSWRGEDAKRIKAELKSMI